MENGVVIWITGLSGAGKSTLARELLPNIAQPRLHLDGDELREALSPLAGGYAPEQRLKLGLTYARLACLAAKQGQNVICSTISLFHSVHNWNRNNIENYFEVYLNTSLDVLEKRDIKTIYKNNISNIIGKTIDPEIPINPDLVINNTEKSIYETKIILLDKIINKFPKIISI